MKRKRSSKDVTNNKIKRVEFDMAFSHADYFVSKIKVYSILFYYRHGASTRRKVYIQKKIPVASVSPIREKIERIG